MDATLQEIYTGFVTGNVCLNDSGRDRQALLREWKAHLATATECWKRITVSSSSTARGQARPLKTSISQVTSLVAPICTIGD